MSGSQQLIQLHFITHEDEEDLSLKILEMEEEQLVAAVECTPKATRGQRKGILEGVVTPTHPQAKGKGNQAPALLQAPKEPPTFNQAPKKSPIKEQAPKNAPTEASNPQSNPVPTPVPIEAHPYLFDATNDAIMEDLSHQTIKPSTQEPNDGRKIKPVGPLASSLAQATSPKAIVNHILDTPFTLSLGEVIGTSKEVTQQLQDLIRIRRQPPPITRSFYGTPPNASLMCLTSSPLITINVHCNGQLINAVIDSGSTLNVVKESIANSIIRLPINRRMSTNIRDANGGLAKLTGMISEVPLFCGAAKTWANIFVSPDNDSNFGLLLGRPWMQGNSISIIEKASGTYLIFGADPEIPLEMCVQKGAISFETGFLVTQEPGSNAGHSSGSLSQPTSPPVSPSMSSSSIHSPALTMEGITPSAFRPFPDTLSHVNRLHSAPERLGEGQEQGHNFTSASYFITEQSSPPSPVEEPSRPQTPSAHSELSQGFRPTQMIPLLRLPPPNNTSLATNPAIQRLSTQFERVTRGVTSRMEPAGPVGSPLSPHYSQSYAQAYTDAHHSLLGTLESLAGYSHSLREIMVDTAHATPGERGIDVHGNQYQDFSCIVSELTVAHPETLQDNPQMSYTSYPGAAYVCFYPYPGNPTKHYGMPMDQAVSPTVPVGYPFDPYDDSDHIRSPTPSWLAIPSSSWLATPSPPSPSPSEEPVETCLSLPDSTPSCLLISEDTDMNSPGSFLYDTDDHSELVYPSPPPPLSPQSDLSAFEPAPGPEIVEDQGMVMEFTHGHIFMFRTPTGWIAEIEENPPSTLTLPTPPASPESEDSSEFLDDSSPSNLLLLASAVEFAEGTSHPYPFDSVTYPESFLSNRTSDTSHTLDDFTNLYDFQDPQSYSAGHLTYPGDDNQTQPYFWFPPLTEEMFHY